MNIQSNWHNHCSPDPDRNTQGNSDSLHKQIFVPDRCRAYFLFPLPIDRSSKLLSVSSRPPLVARARVKEDDFDSSPGWILWVVDRRPLLEASRLDRFSLGSPEELGRLLEITALFEVLPFREDDRGLSESGCCKREGIYKKQQAVEKLKFRKKGQATQQS